MKLDGAHLHRLDDRADIVRLDQARMLRIEGLIQHAHVRHFQPPAVALEEAVTADSIRRPDNGQRTLGQMRYEPFAHRQIVFSELQLGGTACRIDDTLRITDADTAHIGAIFGSFFSHARSS